MGTCERRFRRAFFIAFMSRIVFRESFIDPILVVERHFHLKSDTRDFI